MMAEPLYSNMLMLSVFCDVLAADQMNCLRKNDGCKAKVTVAAHTGV
jgi:hypothetical protein